MFSVPLPIAAGVAAGGPFSPIMILLLGVLFVMAAAGLILISWLFHRLRNRHPSAYESIGSPSLFWNNSVRNNLLFLKFLFSSHAWELDDPQLSRVVLFLRVFLLVYVVLFLSCGGCFLTGVAFLSTCACVNGDL